jgi:hypothetical protein
VLLGILIIIALCMIRCTISCCRKKHDEDDEDDQNGSDNSRKKKSKRKDSRSWFMRILWMCCFPIAPLLSLLGVWKLSSNTKASSKSSRKKTSARSKFASQRSKQQFPKTGDVKGKSTRKGRAVEEISSEEEIDDSEETRDQDDVEGSDDEDDIEVGLGMSSRKVKEWRQYRESVVARSKMADSVDAKKSSRSPSRSPTKIPTASPSRAVGSVKRTPESSKTTPAQRDLSASGSKDRTKSPSRARDSTVSPHKARKEDELRTPVRQSKSSHSAHSHRHHQHGYHHHDEPVDDTELEFDDVDEGALFGVNGLMMGHRASPSSTSIPSKQSTPIHPSRASKTAKSTSADRNRSPSVKKNPLAPSRSSAHDTGHLRDKKESSSNDRKRRDQYLRRSIPDEAGNDDDTGDFLEQQYRLQELAHAASLKKASHRTDGRMPRTCHDERNYMFFDHDAFESADYENPYLSPRGHRRRHSVDDDNDDDMLNFYELEEALEELDEDVQRRSSPSRSPLRGRSPTRRHDMVSGSADARPVTGRSAVPDEEYLRELRRKKKLMQQRQQR